MTDIKKLVATANAFSAAGNGISAGIVGWKDFEKGIFKIESNDKAYFLGTNIGNKPSHQKVPTPFGVQFRIFQASLGEITPTAGKPFPVMNKFVDGEKGIFLKVETFPESGENPLDNLGWVVAHGCPKVIWQSSEKFDDRLKANDALLWLSPGDAVCIAFAGEKAYMVSNLDGKIAKRVLPFLEVSAEVDFLVGSKLTQMEILGELQAKTFFAGMMLMWKSFKKTTTRTVGSKHYDKFVEVLEKATDQDVTIPDSMLAWVNENRGMFGPDAVNSLIEMHILKPTDLGLKSRTASSTKNSTRRKLGKGVTHADESLSVTKPEQVINMDDLMVA